MHCIATYAASRTIDWGTSGTVDESKVLCRAELEMLIEIGNTSLHSAARNRHFLSP